MPVANRCGEIQADSYPTSSPQYVTQKEKIDYWDKEITWLAEWFQQDTVLPKAPINLSHFECVNNSEKFKRALLTEIGRCPHYSRIQVDALKSRLDSIYRVCIQNKLGNKNGL